MAFRGGGLHEWVHHVACAPDAHADAHFAVFFRRERVAACGVVGGDSAEAGPKRFDVVLGFDLDAFPGEGLHCVVTKPGFEHVWLLACQLAYQRGRVLEG